MIKAEQIPYEAVEAAAKKEYEIACARGSNTWPKWEFLPAHRQELWRNDARAMITAALNAWPGAGLQTSGRITGSDASGEYLYALDRLILPLTQENNNA